jgi:hypothetical protein
MTYISIFIKIGSGFQKLVRGIHRHRESMIITYASYYFSQNEEGRIEIIFNK